MHDDTNPRCYTSDGRYYCQYCTPLDVMRAIRVVDYHSPDSDIFEPSDANVYPQYDELIFRICAKEDELDRYTGVSYKENRVVNYMTSLGTYWHDINGARPEYWLKGGYLVQLNQDVRPWDPSKGDRLYMRTLQNTWKDMTDMLRPNPPQSEEEWDCGLAYCDYDTGRLYMYGRYLQPKDNAIRITYRYGRTEPVPPMISRACALMVGLTLLNEEIYQTRLGTGGDLGSQKNDMKRAMQDEINSTIMCYRRFTPVYSLYQ